MVISRGLRVSKKTFTIKLKFESKTARLKREAKARAKLRREARVKRLAQEALSKQERANARAKRKQKTADLKLAAQSLALARREARRLASQQKADARLYNQAINRALNRGKQSPRDAYNSAYLREIEQLLKKKLSPAAYNRAYLREIERLLRDKKPKKKPGAAKKKPVVKKKPGAKEPGERQRPGCNHAPVRERTARGRRKGEKISYSDRQTARYQSLWLREQKARMLLAPRKSGGYYLFTPGACRGESYRVSAAVPPFADQVQTLSDVQEGGLVRLWEFKDLVFRWAVTYPPTPTVPDDPFSVLPPSAPPTPYPPPNPPGEEAWAVCRVVYVLVWNQTYVIKGVHDGSGGAAPGPSAVLAKSADQFFHCVDEYLLPGLPPTQFWYTEGDTYDIYHEVGYVRFISATGRLTSEPLPLDFPPLYGVPGAPSPPYPGTPPGDPGTAGITWTSTVFPLAVQQDILLKFAYSVRTLGAGDSYIEVLQNGTPWKRLLLDDYTKGAHQLALPITLLAGATYQFIIRIAPESHIDAAIARLGGQYVCNCPDYAKLEPGFASRFLSEMSDRNWENSSAGIKVIGDCKHIMRVKMLLGESLDPSNPPDLDALQQWRKGRDPQQMADRKQQRKHETAMRRSTKEDLAAARRKDKDEREAPARARRKAKRDAAKLRKARRLQFERLQPGLAAQQKRERKARVDRRKFVQRLNGNL
jgi:hypothetical protein